MTAIYDMLNAAMRERYGNSVTRLADAFDVPVQSASKWLAEDERKRTIPTPASCEKIASGLGLDPDYVLELAGHRKPSPDRAVINPRLAAFLAEVEQAWLAADEQVRDMGERTTRAVFRIEDTRRLPPGRRRRVTKPDEPFGRLIGDGGLQGHVIRNSDIERKQSRSLRSMTAEFGLQPA